MEAWVTHVIDDTKPDISSSSPYGLFLVAFQVRLKDFVNKDKIPNQ